MLTVSPSQDSWGESVRCCRGTPYHRERRARHHSSSQALTSNLSYVLTGHPQRRRFWPSLIPELTTNWYRPGPILCSISPPDFRFGPHNQYSSFSPSREGFLNLGTIDIFEPNYLGLWGPSCVLQGVQQQPWPLPTRCQLHSPLPQCDMQRAWGGGQIILS